MGMYDTLSKLDDTPPMPAKRVESSVKIVRRLKAAPIRTAQSPKEIDAMADAKESSLHDSITDVNGSTRHDVMTSVSREEVTRWRKMLANSETHGSALRLSAQERDDVEDCVLLLRRTYGIKTSMNELVRLGLLLLVRDVRTRKSKSVICAVKES